MPNYYDNKTPTMNINDVKYDLLKISELYDGVLQAGMGELPLGLFRSYLNDLCDDNLIYSYEFTDIVLKEHSYTYDINIKSSYDRSPKKIKIHIGLYKSAWPNVVSSMKYTKDKGYVNA